MEKVGSFLNNNIFWIAVVGGVVYIVFFTEIGSVVQCALNPVSCGKQVLNDLEKGLGTMVDGMNQLEEDVVNEAKKLPGEFVEKGQSGFLDYSKSVKKIFVDPAVNTFKDAANSATTMYTPSGKNIPTPSRAKSGFSMGAPVGVAVTNSASDIWHKLQNMW